MKIVTAAIIIRDEKVLIARRKANEKLEGFWEFPGGKIENDENPQECLERELIEELGVRSKAGEIIAESEYRYDHAAIKLLAILTTLIDTDFTLHVHDKAEWVRLHSLLDYKLAPADIPIAKVIMEKYSNAHQQDD